MKSSLRKFWVLLALAAVSAMILLSIMALGQEREPSELRLHLQRVAESRAIAKQEVFKDILHCNHSRIPDGISDCNEVTFLQENILITSRNLSMSFVINQESREVVWLRTGMFYFQHDATLLGNGNILVFDNKGFLFKEEGRYLNSSRVVEFNTATDKIIWSYGEIPRERFYSHILGAIQRLPNGNTLIVDSVSGRAFEVTPRNKIIWNFNSPFRVTSPEGSVSKKILVASLFDLK